MRVQNVNGQRLVTLVLVLSIVLCGTGIVVLLLDAGATIPSALCGCLGTSGLLLGDHVSKRPG